MAININAGFHVGAPTHIDDRSYLSKAQMLAINENIYPDHFLATCSDDGKLYMFDKNAAASAETGKFTALATDAVRPIQVTEIPAAAATEAGNVYQYVGADETTYTQGYWYICSQNVDTQVYEWVRIDVQPNGAVTLAAAETATEGAAKTYVLRQFDEEVGKIDIPDASVALTVAETATDGYLKTYVLSQAGAELGKIDIPKDLVVTSGIIETIVKTDDMGWAGNDGVSYFENNVADEESPYYGYPTPAEVPAVFIKLTIANQKLPVFINVKDMMPDDLGDLSRPILSNVEVGGIQVNEEFAIGTTFTEFVEALLRKHYPPTISLASTPENRVVEIGQSVNVELTATSFGTTYGLGGLTLYQDGTEMCHVECPPEYVQGLDWDYTHAVDDAITTDTTFRAVISDFGAEKTKTAEVSISYVFVNPYYSGVVASDATVALADLNKYVDTVGTKTYTFTADNQNIVFAQPISYAALTSILDGNGFENIDSFSVDETTIDGYRVYMTKQPVTCTNFKYTFK